MPSLPCVNVALYAPVLDYMSFKFMLQNVCVLYPDLNLPVSVNVCYKGNQTKKTDKEIERGKNDISS